jgi:hypothetical protein
MTREDIKQLFPDATDEQINNILNKHNAEKEAVKKTADKGVSDEELKQLRDKAKAYDDAEKEKMTAEQKYEALIKEAEETKAEAARIRAKMKAEAEFIKAGLTEKEYADLLDDVIGEDDEKTLAKVGRITKLMKDKTDAAVKSTEEKLMKDSSQPRSNNSGEENKDGKQATAADALAKELAGASSSTKSYEETMNYYG